MAAHQIPEGYRSVTPYLINEGAAKVIAFLGKAYRRTLQAGANPISEPKDLRRSQRGRERPGRQPLVDRYAQGPVR